MMSTMSVIIHNTCITERQLEGSHDPDPVIEFDLLRLQAVINLSSPMGVGEINLS
jgi:hypothetical protein